ncbi:ATP-binding cassette domain-containing protein [Limobrevibacterium gyesilva]|uniref:ATP-binding cassette domain-containing protein n=1 Tax=Limobrevibacterium gyesilva TaxID=2991712 RepID=A0AA42CEB6_9PROT|nr:ATP-binding cassette domain-containing protein [Limobrevibacterium gyesilva]MCW3475069.1 ATP-binding cassette domain-containing protein [Limobrevibacterium gyesilva]
MPPALAEISGLRHVFPGARGAPPRVALDGISAVIPPGMITGVVGPDAAGKTTVLRLLAGLLRPTGGRVTVLGHDMATDAQAAHAGIGYMPQRFGLYEDLSVAENLSLFADLHQLPAGLRTERVARLLRFTGLAPFTARLAGQLSGGMKQKLGLACALLARPRLLLLDEPSVGVDPASRRELWSIVSQMLEEGREDGMGVVWATAYLDEAERCGQVLLLHEGRMLAAGPPAGFLAPMQGRVFRLAVPAASRRDAARRAAAHPGVLDAAVQGDTLRLVLHADAAVPDAASLGGTALAPAPPRFEDGFVDRLATAAAPPPPTEPIRPQAGDGPAIEVRDLVRRFGAFTAVDHVSFSVARGEIFGLLGPNGAGKSTTFRMLCGLLQPSGGTARVAGQDMLRAPAAARARIGYMAQRFSLYGELSVAENLAFFARVYGLSRATRAQAIAQALQRYDLAGVAGDVAGNLPLGVKQRLALAAALLHGPDILFLDEPTSGVDPLTRRAFWARIGALAQAGVTVLVTSHFMDEAEYCDRLAIVSAGRLVATGTPAELRARVRSAGLPDPTLEDAFIALVAAGPAELAA